MMLTGACVASESSSLGTGACCFFLLLLLLQNCGLLASVHGLPCAACPPRAASCELRAVARWVPAIWGPENKIGALG